MVHVQRIDRRANAPGERDLGDSDSSVGDPGESDPGAELAAAALVLLAERENSTGVPMVDESERHRLAVLAEHGRRPGTSWHAWLAIADGDALGYGGGTADEGRFTADLVVAPSPRAGAATHALTASLRDVVPVGGELLVWVRGATADDEARMDDTGFAVRRRLDVLGRDLAGVLDHPVDIPAGIDLHSFEPERDTDGVVRVLQDAYRGTDDGGWDRERFRTHTHLEWFRAEDLLVARDRDGSAVGVHWTKRRGHGVGEVHNLAVHPDAHGRGLGRALLWRGLQHLAEVGCERAILWVDAANGPAVSLYRRAGFARLWSDVAFADRR